MVDAFTQVRCSSAGARATLLDEHEYGSVSTRAAETSNHRVEAPQYPKSSADTIWEAASGISFLNCSDRIPRAEHGV